MELKGRGNMLDVSIVISTFGNEEWKELAKKRALPSAESFGVPVIYNHGMSLHETRNLGLSQVETEFVCHLDADDVLSPNFFDYMSEVEGDLRPPSVRYVHQGVTFMPRVTGMNGVHQHVCVGECLTDGNWLVVGTVARTETLRKVGGWREWGNWEDWDLFLRCWLSGATITPVPDSLYLAYSIPQGRSRRNTHEEDQVIYHAIRKANLPHLYSFTEDR